MTEPIIKFPGGKRELLKLYEPYFPPPGDRQRQLIEPMAGGAAMILAWHPRWGRAWFGDKSPDLSCFYQALCARPQDVLLAATDLVQRYNAADWSAKSAIYYATREAFNRGEPGYVKGAQFWFLNCTGFNGLVRYSSSGFNVPWGQRESVTESKLERLLDVGRVLQSSTTFVGNLDYTSIVTIAGAKHGDIVYFDPPYAGTFCGYTVSGFVWSEQVRLRNFVEALRGQGVFVYVSNSDRPEVRELYRGLLVHIEIQARRNINRNGAGRGKVGELLLVPPEFAG